MSISILIPVLLGIAALFKEELFLYAIASTMATGAIQLVAGGIFWFVHRDNLDIKLYFSGVVGFFLLAHFLDGLFIVWFVPPLLCMFLFWIVFTQKQSHEN